jgi:hypothetical protein
MVEISLSGSGEGPGWATSRPTLQSLFRPVALAARLRRSHPSLAALAAAPGRRSSPPERRTARRRVAEYSLDMPHRMG